MIVSKIFTVNLLLWLQVAFIANAAISYSGNTVLQGATAFDSLVTIESTSITVIKSGLLHYFWGTPRIYGKFYMCEINSAHLGMAVDFYSDCRDYGDCIIDDTKAATSGAMVFFSGTWENYENLWFSGKLTPILPSTP